MVTKNIEKLKKTLIVLGEELQLVCARKEKIEIHVRLEKEERLNKRLSEKTCNFTLAG